MQDAEKEINGKKERQIIFFGNIPFEVFGTEGILKEFANHANAIILSDLPFNGEEYRFVFNKVGKKVEQHPNIDKYGDYEYIILPKFTVESDEQIDPYKLRKINIWSKEGNWGVHYADSYMRGYLNGRPVEFDFAGTLFTLDVEREILYESANPQNIIRLNELPSSPAGYELDYDPELKNVIPYQETRAAEFHMFDQMVAYDPLGMAKKYAISVGRLPEYDQDLHSEQVVEKCKQYTGPVPEKAEPYQQPVEKKEKGRKLNGRRRSQHS